VLYIKADAANMAGAWLYTGRCGRCMVYTVVLNNADDTDNADIVN